MRRRYIASIAALMALAFGAATVWRTETPATAAPAAAPPAAGVDSVRIVATGSAVARLPTMAPRDSLRDTDVDGAVRVDANGDPVADRDLRRLFDYFLQRLGERSPEAIRASVVAWLERASGVTPRAQARVLELFDAYVDAERAAAMLTPDGDLADDLARRAALRRDRLGAALADAWFGDDERYADYTARRLALERDAALFDAERVAQRDALAREADPARREALHESTDFQTAVAQSAVFDADGANAAQRHAERAALWGGDAADRLAQLDTQRAAWRQRVQDFARARAAIERDASLSASTREARIEALLASGFDEAERRRVLALAEAGM
jgi:lipase chaperone LimK